MSNDLDNPDWAGGGRVHNWRNYISPRVRALWATFTREQREALQAQAQVEADSEEWD